MAHTTVCPRHPVKKLMQSNALSPKFLETMEHNQKISSCCRHPENHEIEARTSKPDLKVPDIYVFYCTCGRKHIRLCGGKDDARPFWKVK